MHTRLVNPGKVTPLVEQGKLGPEPFNLIPPLENSGLMDSLVSPGLKMSLGRKLEIKWK